MKFEFNPLGGVCPKKISFKIENRRICGVCFEGGCAGNTIALAKVIDGMTIEDACSKLSGIPCGNKKTSCPDQLAKGIRSAVKKMEEMNKKTA